MRIDLEDVEELYDALDRSPDDSAALIERFAAALHQQAARQEGGVQAAPIPAMIASLLPVTAAEYERRIGICVDCPHAKIGGGGKLMRLVQCAQCGCVMNVKARMRGPRCPEGRF
jgi:hypothetical protein